MTIYKIRRAFKIKLDCPFTKSLLCALAYCPQFTINSLAEQTALTHEQIHKALNLLVEKHLIKFLEGTYESLEGTMYQVEILF
jgi:hypothetical protein